jgi:hypothetical protein
MRKVISLLVLTGIGLLLPPSALHAEEQPAALPPPVEVTISAEDQKVIAAMELLQMMELLQDFEVMTAGEKK